MVNLILLPARRRKICAGIIFIGALCQMTFCLMITSAFLAKFDLRWGFQNGHLYIDFAKTSAVLNVSVLILFLSLVLMFLCAYWGIKLYRGRSVPLLTMTIFGMLLSPFGILITLSSIFVLWKCAQAQPSIAVQP